jgi:aspartate racemase
MKTIGLLGGMSWESTELYYRLINEETRRVLGGLHSAPIAMISVDFHEIERLQLQEDWDASARLLSEKARRVEAAGADLLLICTNTMHKVADQVADAIGIYSARGSRWSNSSTRGGWSGADSRCWFRKRRTGPS